MNKPKYPRNERNKWYAQVEACKRSVKEVCQIFGISRQCYYEWHVRDRAARRKYRTDLPKKNQPNTKLTTELKSFIKETKLRTNYGPDKMMRYVRKKKGVVLSTTIIYRYYRKEKLIRKPQRRQPWYAPLKSRLVIRSPGEGVQMDVKYVYEGRYQFSVCDPYTRLYHFTICETKHSRNCIATYRAAEKYFGFTIRSVQTDNGSEARGVFHMWLTEKQIPHYFIPKASPWWDGYVERVHRTIDDEYYHNPWRQFHSPLEWLEYYNTERIHQSLGDLTPREKLQSVTIDC